MKRAAMCALALHLALVPCFADVIPSKYDDKDAGQRQAVKARLVDLGVAAPNAEHRIKQLDSDELAYFAQDPQRIQPAGSLYWYEWVGGALVGVLVVVLLVAAPIKVESK